MVVLDLEESRKAEGMMMNHQRTAAENHTREKRLKMFQLKKLKKLATI